MKKIVLIISLSLTLGACGTLDWSKSADRTCEGVKKCTCRDCGVNQ